MIHWNPNLAKVEDAPYSRHQGRSRSRLLQALDNEEDGVSLAFDQLGEKFARFNNRNYNLQPIFMYNIKNWGRQIKTCF